MMKKYFQIALDGPAGAGKSTITKILSEKLGYTMINSGGIFRCITLATIQNNIDPNDKKSIIDLLKKIDVTQEGKKLILNNKDVTKLCYESNVANLVAKISPIEEVRLFSHEVINKLSKGTNVVIEGRDTTTVIFPNATLKVFVTADPMLRAQRRWEQTNKTEDLNVIYQDLLKRDEADTTRKISPLKKADDAILLDTTGKTAEECVEFLINEFNKRIK